MEDLSQFKYYRPQVGPLLNKHAYEDGYGVITWEMFPDKNRQSEGVFEDEGQVDFNARSLMRDFSPDRPTLASDMPRDNRVTSGRMINLHTYGVAGSTLDPYNDNINTQFTDWDPRGTNVGPDFNQIKKQGWLRADDWEPFFTSDDDPKDTEGIKNPYDVMQDIKNAFYQTKARMKWFETSKDNYAPGFQPTSGDDTMVAMTAREGSSVNPEVPLDHKDYLARRNPVDMASNLSPRYAREATDHEFKVSSYNKLYRMKVPDLAGSKLNNVAIDQLAPILDSSKSSLANKSKLAIAILTSAKKKITGDQRTALSRELVKVGRSKAKKLAESQTNLVILDQVSPELRGLIRRNINRAAPILVEPDSTLTKVQTYIKASAINNKEAGNHGRTLEMSAFNPSDNRREAVVYIKHRGDMKVMSYKTKLPEIPTQYGAITDADMAASHNTMERGIGVFTFTSPDVNSTENEVAWGENKWFDRHLAPMGDKYVSKYQEESGDRESLMDEIKNEKKGKRSRLNVKKAGKKTSERSAAMADI